MPLAMIENSRSRIHFYTLLNWDSKIVVLESTLQSFCIIMILRIAVGLWVFFTNLG